MWRADDINIIFTLHIKIFRTLLILLFVDVIIQQVDCVLNFPVFIRLNEPVLDEILLICPYLK